MEIEEHQQAMISAFAEVLKAEDEMAAAKRELADASALLGQKVNGAEFRLHEAWSKVKVLMDSTGEFEVTLPGSVTDYKIGYSAPRESVKAEDANAVPDEFCKIERKPRLKEIGDFLKALRDSDKPLPNWGRLELGERKLQWKAVKRNAT